jgi:hypothetical protein
VILVFGTGAPMRVLCFDDGLLEAFVSMFARGGGVQETTRYFRGFDS